MRELISMLTSTDTHPIIQFIKYGIAGGFATTVHMFIFFLMAWKICPALTAKDPFVRLFQKLKIEIPPSDIDDKKRSNHMMFNNFVAFMFSNFVAYIINILWVFESGKHTWYVELGMFYAVSGISMFIGTALGGALVRWARIATTYAFIANIVTSVMINYVCRKFFIFNG